MVSTLSNKYYGHGKRRELILSGTCFSVDSGFISLSNNVETSKRILCSKPQEDHCGGPFKK